MINMSFDADKIQFLPTECGIYLMKNRDGEVLYIGKAKNLRNRIRSYFNPDADKRLQIPYLLKQLDDIETIITPDEHQAFLLENVLIKQHQPHFNIRLRDDKDFISIRIDTSHPFPRMEMMRRRRRAKDKALYFGPFTSVKDVRETVRLLRKIFPLRNCKENVFKNRTRPCLQYEIKRCFAPCVKKISQQDYAELVHGVIRFLNGEGSVLIKDLKHKMVELSERMEFEKAAELRDRISAIEHSMSTQNVALQKWDNKDIFGAASDDFHTVIIILIYRNGNLISTKDFIIKNQIESPDEILGSALMQYYDSGADIPDEVIIDREIEDMESAAIALSEKRGRKVSVTCPQRGEKTELAEIAVKNASMRLEQKNRREKDTDTALLEIQRTLNLPTLPNHIEAFDISNIQGVFAVGSMVAFINGTPDKSRYRRYKIQTVTGSNDFAMMRETIDRRYKRALLEERKLPDLLLVDGGKGQLDMAVGALEDLNITNLPVVSIAKSRVEPEALDNMLSPYITNPDKADNIIAEKKIKTPKTVDRFFIPGRKNPIFFQPGAQGLKLLMNVRDEAHRFAVEYHRRLMKSQRFSSVLEEIPGIGPKQRKKLLSVFGSLQGVKEAPLEALMSIGEIPENLAVKIFNFFRSIN